VIESVFSWLLELVQTTFLISLLGSFLWGILSILLSPCHLASIPLIVGFISQQGVKSFRKAFWTSFTFSSGILLTISLIGLVTALLGRIMGDIGKWGNILVAVIFFIVGLYLLGIIRIYLPGVSGMKFNERSILAAFFLGLVYGIALGPCTFAYMAPVLAITLFSSSSNFLHSFSLLAAYGLGHCLVIVIAGTFTGAIQKYLKWTEQSRGTKVVKIICGILIILGGIYLLTI
jgi:cytochrome c-type biogenesis protein